MGKRGIIHVDFGNRKRLNGDPYPLSFKKHGGCGVLSTPEPYQGKPTWKLEVWHRGTKRHFVVVHLDRSPTGSGHGSFRIDEELRGRTITHGYTCSYPDESACLRVANAY